MSIIIAFLVIGILALVLGLGLSIADKKLAIEKDPKLVALEESMPGANCGGCGFAGCSAYAEAVFKGTAEAGLCSPGGAALAQKMKSALGDAVKDVVISSRLSADSAAVIVMDENDPSIQMQKILKQMGGGEDLGEIKPILEVNADNALIKKIDQCTDEEMVKDLSSVVLNQAYIAEGIMPKDPAAFVRKVTRLLG